MTKLCIITDTHANLPALQTTLTAIEQEGYDQLIHLGDAIAIGPHPAECLDLLLSTPRTRFIMGNHDDWFAHGLPRPQPTWMSDGELIHQKWTHAQLTSKQRWQVWEWPFHIIETIEGIPVTFVHYALTSNGRTFKQIIREPTPLNLDYLFAAHDSELIFYGHHHPFSDIQGASRYINPGSLGCHTEAMARYTVAEFFGNGRDWRGDRYTITHKAIPYDDTPLRQAFTQRQVPERELLWKAFFGGR